MTTQSLRFTIVGQSQNVKINQKKYIYITSKLIRHKNDIPKMASAQVPRDDTLRCQPSTVPGCQPFWKRTRPVHTFSPSRDTLSRPFFSTLWILSTAVGPNVDDWFAESIRSHVPPAPAPTDSFWPKGLNGGAVDVAQCPLFYQAGARHGSLGLRSFESDLRGKMPAAESNKIGTD